MNISTPSTSTNRPTSEHVLHPKAFQSWRWVFLAALLLATVAITTFYFSSAQAQNADGAIAGLTLTSTTAGTLTVSWDAASPVPTDYRVDWAKSGEDYKSWKVDDGHVYLTPDATTTTITDLAHDTEYKIRMRARYYRGEHEGKSWGGPWAEATITVAGEPAETPTPEPVQEEESTTEAGAIDTLTAADDDTGQLVLTWGSPAAPNATPTDYHVSWAKSAEDYPADTAEAGNDHPTDTTLTLAGLDYDTDYNVRVRARYTDGENADSPWNGPWTETTAQVKLPLPMAINMTGAAVSPASQVYLFWSDPSNDSITGYQILRGPKADSLVVIEDDTGSTSTSYTDTAPPAGQTHTYAVKARNASGLSPLSNTLTATVPAAREEEVLIVARHESSENTLVSNTGQTALTSSAIAGTFLDTHREFAVPFTTGTHPFGYHITGVALPLQRVLPTVTPSPLVSIRADNAGIPSDTVLHTLTTSSTIPTDYQLITFTTADRATLQPDTTYWLYATTAGPNAMAIQYTSSDAEDAESQVAWAIGNTYYIRRNAEPWAESTVNHLRMQISGHEAPDPAPPPVLVSNLGSPASGLSFSTQRNVDRRRYAQTFSAANNADGTQATFDFNGLTFGFSGSATGNLAASHLVVTVNADNSGAPGSVLYTLTSATTTLSRHIDDIREFTFNAPAGATLTSGVTYWLIFAAAPGSNYFDRDYINLALTQDDGEVQGTETVNHWSIGDTSLYDTGSATAQTDQRVVMVEVLGLQLAAPLVSNLGQTTGTPISTDYDERSAQAFVAGPSRAGLGYRFQGIRVSASGTTFFEGVVTPQVRASLHDDSGGIPGARLHTLTVPTNFASTENLADYTLLAPPGTVLRGGARYWVVFEVSDNTLYLEATNSADEDPRLDAWSIDNYSYTNTKQSSGWVSVTRVTDVIPRVIKLAVLGSPQWVTNEADGPDLPGAGHNAHQTNGVVTLAIVSTGHLTAGLDYDHGHSGDYWWLETQRGHSYRVEVKFGDNPDNDTGGSAWMSFIDPDHDDYPYASGCCEADHNRDDGHTFVHFYRPTDDWNNRYLINVAAFDKLNTGSSTYNGPYTITMTDITGTREFVSNLYQDSRSDLLEVGAARQYAIFFETGHHAAGYKLDRIQTFITDQGSPEFSLYSNTIDVPGTKLCDFRNPRQVQHHVTWSAGPPAITFLAPDCAEITLMPTRSAGMLHTYYWIVMEGTNYRLSGMDSYAESTYGSGWRIGDLTVTKTTASWLGDPTSRIIPISVWLSER